MLVNLFFVRKEDVREVQHLYHNGFDYGNGYIVRRYFLLRLERNQNYFSIGGTYYVEKEQVYVTASTGKQDWARTARKHVPLVQKNILKHYEILDVEKNIHMMILTKN